MDSKDYCVHDSCEDHGIAGVDTYTRRPRDLSSTNNYDYNNAKYCFCNKCKYIWCSYGKCPLMKKYNIKTNIQPLLAQPTRPHLHYSCADHPIPYKINDCMSGVQEMCLKCAAPHSCLCAICSFSWCAECSPMNPPDVEARQKPTFQIPFQIPKNPKPLKINFRNGNPVILGELKLSIPLHTPWTENYAMENPFTFYVNVPKDTEKVHINDQPNYGMIALISANIIEEHPQRTLELNIAHWGPPCEFIVTFTSRKFY